MKRSKHSIIEIKPAARLMESNERFDIFVAGSIENGKAEEWQKTFKEEIQKIKTKKISIGIFNPRREDWDPSWGEGHPELISQIEWELDHLEKADLIVMYLQPGTISPISLLELGLYAKEVKANKKRMIVLCPTGFHRKENVNVVCKYFGITMAKDMTDLIKKTKKEIKEYDPVKKEITENLKTGFRTYDKFLKRKK